MPKTQLTPEQIANMSSDAPAKAAPRPAGSPPRTNDSVVEAATAAEAGLRGATALCLSHVQGYIQTTTEQRAQAKQQVVQAIQYLHDPNVFLAECLVEAAGGLTPQDAEKKSGIGVSPYSGFTVPVFAFSASPSASLPPVS